LTLDAGKFVTTAGAEVIEANKNWLYSRSILFAQIPLVHTGIRGTVKVNDMLTLQASVTNGGWNDLGFEGSSFGDKTYGVSANVTAPGGVNIVATSYLGKTVPGGNVRFLGDLVVAYTAGPLGLNLNFDYVKESND